MQDELGLVCRRCGEPVLKRDPRVGGTQSVFCSPECKREHCREYVKSWGQANRVKVREYRDARSDDVKSWNRDFYERHRERRKALRRQRYANNSAVERERNKRYQLKNPDLCRVLGRKSAANRRARLSSVFIEPIDPMVVFKNSDGVCGICLRAVTGPKWEVDHIKPLAAGGLHCYANVQLAHVSCNRSKGARDVPAFG